MTKKKPSGYVLYRGPSLIDGKPIVAIAIVKSGNTKTANMMQTYILRDDIDPRLANKTGEDRSICGDCPHRGNATTDANKKLAENRTCYVVIGQGPTIVYKGFKRGIYPNIQNNKQHIAHIAKDRMVRLGTYGDPAAIPSWVWDRLLSKAKGHTAYSHQSGIKSADVRHDLFMTSADSLTDASKAWLKGRRTFRIVQDISEVSKREVICPATDEGGNKTNCEHCGLCAGSSKQAKSIAVVVHGSGKKNFQQAA